MNCSKCLCTTCELISSCSYHVACRNNNGNAKDYVIKSDNSCKDYIYSIEVDKYINGNNTKEK